MVFICLLLGLVFTIYGFLHIGNESDNVIVTYAITFVSLFISVVALVVALRTYFSIDAVNSITSMDGNVLQNENYSVSYPEQIKVLSVACDIDEYTEKVMELMEVDKKSTYTCVEYADWLQEIIDNIIWIAYVDTNAEKYKEAKKELIDTIDLEYEKYAELSNGIQYTLGEHIKLIKNVLMYIEWLDHGNRSGGNISCLEDIRGRMIQNPVSKTVYYDYVGLNYHKKAKLLIQSEIRELDNLGEINERTAEYYKIISSHQFDEITIEHIRTLSSKSIEAYNRAKTTSSGDMLWEGYIRYNRVRVWLLEKAVFKEKADITYKKIKKELAKVKRIRENIRYLYTDNDTYIGKCFGREIQLVDDLINAYSIFASYNPDGSLSETTS